MKVTVKHWHAVAQCRWDTGSDANNNHPTNDEEEEVWGECTHIFHMHCLLKWIGTAASKQQCPMDRRPWGVFTAERKV
ncbi:hypothetical protein AMATHDRAFT_77455 [Amanita thiersii Skay4041]|uniref:Anaphase-promoting complex subunit 11 n=1 Tax=Amanita thiersii Skay4041 TaxID=703135 RepID=A0A2A9N876_9AGAR|nr:hypothetical protein AMATHDRAFT_77455 [Amanita thiersii Skay4041]